jgi:hypothetical protein
MPAYMRFKHGSSMAEAGLQPVHNMAKTGFNPGLNPVDAGENHVVEMRFNGLSGLSRYKPVPPFLPRSNHFFLSAKPHLNHFFTMFESGLLASHHKPW